jgi:hypothetical protein
MLQTVNSRETVFDFEECDLPFFRFDDGYQIECPIGVIDGAHLKSRATLFRRDWSQVRMPLTENVDVLNTTAMLCLSAEEVREISQA